MSCRYKDIDLYSQRIKKVKGIKTDRQKQETNQK